jgi:hypothetical protein
MSIIVWWQRWSDGGNYIGDDRSGWLSILVLQKQTGEQVKREDTHDERRANMAAVVAACAKRPNGASGIPKLDP